jgi:hypothetical protein
MVAELVIEIKEWRGMEKTRQLEYASFKAAASPMVGANATKLATPFPLIFYFKHEVRMVLFS